MTCVSSVSWSELSGNEVQIEPHCVEPNCWMGVSRTVSGSRWSQWTGKEPHGFRFVEAGAESERHSHCRDFQSTQDSGHAKLHGPDSWFDRRHATRLLGFGRRTLNVSCEYLQTERPVLSVGSPKCKAFMDLQSMNLRDPKFSKILEAELSHPKSLMAIYHWQSEQGRWFFA